MIPIRDYLPTTRRPLVTTAIIAACALVSGWEFWLDRRSLAAMIHSLGLIPAVLTGTLSLPRSAVVVPPAATLFTSMFLHGGLLHLGGNMLYIWIFGSSVENRLGHLRYLLFYLVCGVAAGGAQVLAAPNSWVPVIGASGAISGVLAAYMVLYPRSRILVVIPVGLFLHDVRAFWLLLVWFGLQLLNVFFRDSGGDGGVAWWAHIGGFIAGIVLIRPFLLGAPERRRGGPWG